MGAPLLWKPKASTAAAIDAAGVSASDLYTPAPVNTHLDTALRLTAIALLLRPMGPWFVRPALLALAVLAIVFPRVLRHPAVWGVAALLTAIRIADDWPLADNHIYLLCYWCLGAALALARNDTPRFAAFTSRWLIGLAFAFAVLWKAVLSPDFLDGRFFRVTLLTDPRFGAAAQLIGGLSAQQLDDNRQALASMPHGAELLDPPSVHEPPRLRALAALATRGILVLETAIAVLMLAPVRRAPPWLRHATLLLFCVVTYAFAPVAGFGWLLLVMGLAQLDPENVWWGRAYLFAFLLVLFYDEIPLVESVLNLVS